MLKQAVMYEDAVRRRKQTEALLHIIELMSADIGTGMLVTRIIDASYKLVDAERISMFNVEEITDEHDAASTSPRRPLAKHSAAT